MSRPSPEIVAIMAALTRHLQKKPKKVNLWSLSQRIENNLGQKVSSHSQLKKYVRKGKFLLALCFLLVFNIVEAESSEELLRVNLTNANINSVFISLQPIIIADKHKTVLSINADSAFQLAFMNHKLYLKIYPVLNQSIDLNAKPQLRLLNKFKASENVNFAYNIQAKSLNSKPILKINNKLYADNIELLGSYQLMAKSNDTIALTVINILPLEDYIKSVVPSEMPSSWPIEALKAQAILARSYALANLGKYQKLGFDLKDNIDDQVFSGYIKSSPNVAQACDLTRGMVLTYNGKIISGFYHSSAGGSTDLASNVWHKDIPYLRAVKDFDDSSPYLSWNRKFSVNDLENILFGKKSNIINIKLLTLTKTQRVHTLMINTDNNSLLLGGDQLRNMLHLPSTVFDICYDKDNNLIFTGSGYGHGLGLSQWGAKALAAKGFTSYDILKYYFSSVRFHALTMHSPIKLTNEVVF